MKKILVIEDNEIYKSAAQKHLNSKGIDVVSARDYSEASSYLASPKIEGIITDCFFPEITGSEKRDLGYATIEKMAEVDPLGRKTDPLALAIAKVGNIVGTDAVKQMTANAGAEYRQSVDLYWALEQAVKENEANQPLGVLVAERAEELGLPFVLATSTHHHDELTQPIQNYVGRKHWTLMDCNPGKADEKATPEFWERVLNILERK